jgi:hypothetical protein
MKLRGLSIVVRECLGHANVSIKSDFYALSLPGWQQQTVDAFAESMKLGG